MQDFIEETDSGIYRITREGKVYSQSKIKIPIVGKGMEFSGVFKEIIKPERELTYTLNNRGYYSVGISNKTHMVHRLVAQAYLDNPENKPIVNHKDGNKLNNDVNNLEWCTVAENNAHARETGLHIQAKGHKINYKSADSKAKALANLKDKSALTDEQVRYVRKVYVPRHKDFGASALGRKYGISAAAMSQVIQGNTYKDVV